MIRKLSLFMCSALTLGFLNGCSTVVASGAFIAANEYFNEEDPNFAAQNYAVADYLIQQARTYIKRDSLIIAEPLVDIQTPEISTTIAKLIPEQIGIRLSQLGYRIDLSDVSTSADTNYLRPSIKANEKPEFIVTGNYLRKNNRNVEVKTRIIDLNEGRIVASFDYQVHMTRGVLDLAQPKPKITRIETAQ